jgi:hypothetical protein
MPNIHELKTSDLGLTGSDRPADARQQGARVIGNYFNQTADDQRAVGRDLGGAIEVGGKAAVDYLDHAEISNGMAKFAELQLTLTQQWDQTLKGADPNDPAVAAGFREGVVEPALDKFTGGFNTRRSQDWATGRIATMKDHFWRKTAADQSTLAAVAVRDNLMTLTNTYSTSAALDPASTKEMLLQSRADLTALVDSSPTLSAEHRARILEEQGQKIAQQIAKAGIVSAINQNPDAGLKLASDPELAKYIDGGDVNQFYNQAKRNEKADTVLARQNAREAAAKQSDSNLTQILQRLYDPDVPMDQKPSAKQVAQLPADAMTPGDRLTAFRVIESETKPQALAKSSAIEANVALKGVMDGSVGRDEIHKLKIENKITKEDHNFLMSQLRDFPDDNGTPLGKKRAGFLKYIGRQIDESNAFTGKIDKAGGAKMWGYIQELDRRERELGPAEAHSLYDPSSPNYMGKPERIQPFKKTAAEEQVEFFSDMARVTGAAPVMPSQEIPSGVSAADAKNLPPNVRYFKGTNGTTYTNPNWKP